MADTVSISVLMLVLCTVSKNRAEVFSASAGLEALVETHHGVVETLQRTVEQTKYLLDFFNRTLAEFKQHNDLSKSNTADYLGNPINAFSLVKRLTLDLNRIHEFKNSVIDEISRDGLYIKDRYAYPGTEDLKGAVNALIRLQETYKLNVKDLAEGRLNNIQYSLPMSIDDCQQLGVLRYEANDYYYAQQWLMEAVKKWELKKDQLFNITKSMNYLAYLSYKMGDIEKAVYWTDRIIKIEPDNTHQQNNKIFYENLLREKKAKGEATSAELANFRVEDKTLTREQRIKYEALCRGDFETSPAVAKTFHCYYKFGKHPFLKLAPLKVEEKYLNPNLYVFHGVMSDDEIEIIKDMARPALQRASVQSSNGTLYTADYRVSQSAWLDDDDSPVVARVSQRIMDMTELNMLTAEMLQIANYGIGGHYEPHYDMNPSNEDDEREDGNRIATILFYMSDVAQGGGTAFMDVGITLFPEKGSAAYWRNLHPSCAPDLHTMHAACPVLQGFKWVANKWLHQVGQEFHAPCDLEYQDGHQRDIAEPIRRANTV